MTLEKKLRPLSDRAKLLAWSKLIVRGGRGCQRKHPRVVEQERGTAWGSLGTTLGVKVWLCWSRGLRDLMTPHP